MKSLDTLTKNGNLVLFLVENAKSPLYETTSNLHWTLGFNASDCGPVRCENQIIGWDWEHDMFTLTEATVKAWEPLGTNPKLHSMDSMPKNGTVVLVHVTKNDYSFDNTHTGWMLAIDWSEQNDEGLQLCGWDYDIDDIINISATDTDDYSFQFHGWIRLPQTVPTIDEIRKLNTKVNKNAPHPVVEGEMNLHEFFTLFNYKITDGSEFLWKCFGDHARSIELSNDNVVGLVVFSKLTQEIFQAEVYNETAAIAYRWMSPVNRDAYRSECTTRNVSFSEAWDGCDFIDVETPEAFMKKAQNLIDGEKPDECDEVEIKLSNDEIVALSLEAHKRNITLNEMMNVALREMLDKIESGEITIEQLQQMVDEND